MALKIENLAKTYPNGVKAIDDLSITIDKGMFGLLGPNGAGKSTLMRTIATLQRPDRGSILFDQIDVLSNPIELRKVLGYLPQDFGVYPKVSATELLDYFAVLKGVHNKSERKSLIQSVLSLTNLDDVQDKYVSGYSGGMKQRFGIAQLLLNQPELLIVDEPTAGLDPAERNRFLNVLREIGKERTVIFSTHIVEDVKDLCTDMAIINHGKILMRMAPQTALDQIKDHIWGMEVDDGELAQFQDELISSGYTSSNRLSLRLFSKEQPHNDAQIIQPILEDVYFLELKKHAKSNLV